jgi:hypothetical protein
MSEATPLDPIDSPAPPPVVLQQAATPIELTPEQKAAHSRFATRLWCLFIMGMCVPMLAIAVWLTPKAEGFNTHTELGLAPCEWFERTGIPCPTCGCTTAVAHFAHGHILRSFITQPFGFLVALLATALVPLTLVGVVTGKWRGPSMFWLGWHWKWWTYGGIIYLAAAWLFKICAVKMGF